jgi:hypothetical protein
MSDATTSASPSPAAGGNPCPKCGASLQATAIACPQCGAQVAQAKSEWITLTTGQKIAALVFILNGISLVAEAILSKDAHAAQGARSAIISVVIGIYLFSNKASALKWAKIAVVLGGILYTGVSIAQGDVATAVTQVLFSLSLAGLLFGTAGKIRLAACCLLIFGYLSLETYGLYLMVHPDQAAAQGATADPASTPAPATTPTK